MNILRKLLKALLASMVIFAVVFISTAISNLLIEACPILYAALVIAALFMFGWQLANGR